MCVSDGFHERLRRAMVAGGVSVNGLAERLAVRTQVVLDLCRGFEQPTRERAVELAEICGVNAVWLATGTVRVELRERIQQLRDKEIMPRIDDAEREHLAELAEMF